MLSRGDFGLPASGFDRELELNNFDKRDGLGDFKGEFNRAEEEYSVFCEVWRSVNGLEYWLAGELL